MTKGIKIAITPQLLPDPNAVIAATTNTIAGNKFMGIASPRFETIYSAVCRSLDTSANAQASNKTSNPININLTPLNQASSVSLILKVPLLIDNMAAVIALRSVECIRAENVSELPSISFNVDP